MTDERHLARGRYRFRMRDEDDEWDPADYANDGPHVPKSKERGFCDFCLREGPNPCYTCDQSERYERESGGAIEL